GTHLGDETSVGRSATARNFGTDSADFLRYLAGDAHQFSPRREIRMPRGGPLQPIVEPVATQHRLEPLDQALAGARRRIAEVEKELERARDDVGRAGSGMDVRRLPGGRREIFVAFVPPERRELSDSHCSEMYRIAGEMRVGDVALHAANGERSGKCSAPAVLDHVAEALIG